MKHVSRNNITMLSRKSRFMGLYICIQLYYHTNTADTIMLLIAQVTVLVASCVLYDP